MSITRAKKARSPDEGTRKAPFPPEKEVKGLFYPKKGIDYPGSSGLSFKEKMNAKGWFRSRRALSAAAVLLTMTSMDAARGGHASTAAVAPVPSPTSPQAKVSSGPRRSDPLARRAGVAFPWESIGPDGGAVLAIRVHPADPSKVFALTDEDSSQVYRSVDGADTWIRAAVFSERIRDLAISPSAPFILYAAGEARLYRSEDDGATWRGAGYPQDFSVPAEDHGYVAVSPSDSRAVYVCGSYPVAERPGETRAAVLASTDGGLTWTDRSGVLHDSGFDRAFDLKTHRDGRALSLLTARGRLDNQAWASPDAGVTWTLLREGTGFRDMAWHPSDGLKMALTDGQHVHMTSDGGRSWTGDAPSIGVRRLAFDPSDPGTLYGAEAGYFGRSTDFGLSWSMDYYPDIDLCNDLAPSAGSLFFASPSGVFLSRSRGGSWSLSMAGLQAVRAGVMAAHSSAPNEIVIADARGRFLNSGDFGETWSGVAATLTVNSLSALLSRGPGSLVGASILPSACGAG